MHDYKQDKIYIVGCKTDDSFIYVGSTTEDDKNESVCCLRHRLRRLQRPRAPVNGNGTSLRSRESLHAMRCSHGLQDCPVVSS